MTRIVQENSDSLRTHRALQMCILQRLDDDQPRRAERFDTVVAILRRAVPIVNVVDRSDSSQFSRFAKYLLQVASVQRVFKNSEPPITGTLSFASVLDDTCYYAYTVRYRSPELPSTPSTLFNIILPQDGCLLPQAYKHKRGLQG